MQKMKNFDPRKDRREKQDSSQDSTKDENLSSDKNITLNVDSLEKTGKDRSKSLFLQRTRTLQNKIPRHVVLLDEKYLRRCLELVHISASSSKSANCSVAVNFLNSAKRVSSYCSDSDNTRFVFEIPSEAVTGGSVIGSTIFGYKNIMRFLDRPPLHKVGIFDFDSNDPKASIFDTLRSSPTGSSAYSPRKNQEKEFLYLGNPKHRSGNLHKRLVSVSSTNSKYSSLDHSLSSAMVSNGTLRCSWENGVPHFVFSLDDQRDVYWAEVSPVESLDDGVALRYSYLFRLREGGGKESRLVGRMNVSTSFSVSTANSKIMEREFVLFYNGGNSQTQSSSHDVRKNKGLQRKVADVFRNSRLSGQRRISRFGKTNSTIEFCHWEPYQETSNDDIESLSGIDLPRNLESAAIVVREHVLEHTEEQEIGGWGLKFLKKKIFSQTRHSSEACMSMDIIIPAGLHGGPRTRIGGPSSLIERWKSNGGCDCGGWDLGCPLTVLNTELRNDEASYQTGSELIIPGSKNGEPARLRIVNVRNGLYLVQFGTMLSALHSFSIAVAYVHRRSPRLRPKIVEPH